MGPPYTQKNPPLHQEVALDDGSGCYADESFIYGGFDDGGCNGGSGMIDLNNGLPIQDSGHALDDQVFKCASPSAEALFACVLDVTPSPDRSLENVGVVEDRLGISVVIIYMKCLFSAHLLKRHLLKLERYNKLCN